MSAVSRKIEILNQRGLHARAAAKFVKVAGAFEAKYFGCHRLRQLVWPELHGRGYLDVP